MDDDIDHLDFETPKMACSVGTCHLPPKQTMEFTCCHKFKPLCNLHANKFQAHIEEFPDVILVCAKHGATTAVEMMRITPLEGNPEGSI